MMFLNYAIWGAWYVTLNTYLTQTLHFSGTQAGAAFGTTALASMVSPFFVGFIADRFFAAERVLAVLHVLGAVVLCCLTQVTSFGAVYGLLLLYCLCYFPTTSLANTLTLRHITDPGTQFPLIRVFATLGWIAVGIAVGKLGIEATSQPFLIAAGLSVALAAFSFLLPHTPPEAKGEPVTVRAILGLDALVMMRRQSYLVFVIASVLACIPLTFYFSFTNTYLNDIGVTNAAGKMTWGQVSEVGMMLAMPFLFKRFSVKFILSLGLLAWATRYVLLGYGDNASHLWMLYAAILLHGVCYDFFFMTGQIYTDQEAPAHLRGTAQGFIIFVTYGVGMFLGSLLSGVTVDFFTAPNGVHNWQGFWLSSAAGAFVIFLMVAVFLRRKEA